MYVGEKGSKFIISTKEHLSPVAENFSVTLKSQNQKYQPIRIQHSQIWVRFSYFLNFYATGPWIEKGIYKIALFR